MADARRPSMRAAKSKSAAENEFELRRRATARKNPRAGRALGQTPVKIAKALQKRSR
jgi:hypothetical protein